MMSRITKSLMMAVCVLSVSSTVWSDTIYVKEGSSGDGSSWANAYGLLQDALDDADPNVEIWVAAGTYKPTYDYDLNIGDRGNHFRMKNHVAIYGGFPNTGDPGMEDRDPNTYETILSGDLAGNDEPVDDPADLLDDPNRSENCLHVFYHPQGTNLDTNAVLDGFTITSGNANEESLWDPNSSGGGMYNYMTSPTVNHCTFTDNTSNTWGGGICIWYSSPIVTRCVFTGNSTEYGGGMCNYNSSPTVNDCIFSGNTVVYYGGGMYDNRSSPGVTHCTFSGNSAGHYGGGMCNYNSNPTVTDCIFTGNSTAYGGGMNNYNNSSPTVTICTFSDNTAIYYGGGIYNDRCSPGVTNCIFSGNSTDYYGGGIYNNRCSPGVTHCTFSGNSAGYYGGGICSNSDFYLTNCILWDNTASDGSQFYNEGTSSALVTYSDIQGGCTGVGNIDADPLFVDAIDGDLHLQSWSPCINRGDPAGAYSGLVDIDGGSRVRYGRVDMGVDEVIPIAGDFDGDERVAGVDLIFFCSHWLQDSCSGPIECSGVDIDASGKVDLIDYAIISHHWLMGY